jgi:hypothetical protein
MQEEPARVAAASVPPTHSAWIRPRLRFGGRKWSTFQVCGCAGLLLALLQSAFLARFLHLPWFALPGMTEVAIATFLGVAMATKVFTGEERITYYHHEIAVLAMVSIFAVVTRLPLLSCLDVAVLGIGLFLACGRIGCLMVGCCHGRIYRRGVRYGAGHVADGFPERLAGVRLFPVQALESAFVLLVVALGMALVFRGSPPGTALGLYVAAYGTGRFWLEFARGDAARPYRLGFSQAQWISLLLAVALVWCEWRGALPSEPWHRVAAVTLALAMLGIAFWRRRDPAVFEIADARHILEIGSALQLLKCAPPPSGLSGRGPIIHVAETSRGYRISEGETVAGARLIRHYSLSKSGQPLSLQAGRSLSNLIAALDRTDASFRLIRGDRGAVHIVFHPPLESAGPTTGSPTANRANR